MKRKLTRKDFLVLCGSASLAALPIFGSTDWLNALTKTKKICLRPLRKNSPSFIRFCQQKRFTSAQEAIKAVKDPTAIFEICYES